MKQNENGRIEYAIAESFTASDGVEVLCEEDNRKSINCEGCYFIDKGTDCPLCTKHMRSDKKNVIYKVLYDPSKSEPKTYFEVGEEFQMGLVRLRCVDNVHCVDNVGFYRCKGCVFDVSDMDCPLDYTGACNFTGRPDRKNVIFVEVGKEEQS